MAGRYRVTVQQGAVHPGVYVQVSCTEDKMASKVFRTARISPSATKTDEVVSALLNAFEQQKNNKSVEESEKLGKALMREHGAHLSVVRFSALAGRDIAWWNDLGHIGLSQSRCPDGS